MPKVTGPLNSSSASGSIGKTLTYRRSKKGFVAVKYSKPTGDPTESQINIRDINKEVAQAWATVSSEDRQTWDNLAASRQVSPFNAFFSVNFSRVLSDESISTVYPPVDVVQTKGCTFEWSGETGSPDPTGFYTLTGTFEGTNLYERLTGEHWFLWYSSEWSIWIVSKVAPGNPSDDSWMGNGLSVNEIYEPGASATGYLIVTELFL